MDKNRISGVLFIVAGLSFLAASILAVFDQQPVNTAFFVLGIAQMTIGGVIIRKNEIKTKITDVGNVREANK